MGRNWAITIGINGYRNLQTLNYAKRDAEAVRDYCQRDVQFEQVYHFSDDSPPIQQDFGPSLDSHPTYATLRRFLRVRFEHPFLSAGDNLWFFFAGHGWRHEERDYLMPLDGDPGDVESTAISLYYITERLRRCGADNVVLLVDACRSASGRRDGLGIGQEKQQGVITLFSCSPQESSYEIAALQQGAFTYALLESLRIQGEGNCATVERLYQRLQYRVPQLNQQHHKPRQTPYGFIEPPTKYHLILLPRFATLADIVTLKNDALRAEVKQDVQLAKQVWIRVLAVSPADPEAIEGIERLARISAKPPVPSPSPSPLSGSGSRQASPSPHVPAKPPVPTFEFESVTIVGVKKAGFLDMGAKVKTQTRKGQAEYYVEDLGNGIPLEMVAIPGDRFMMGSPKTEAERLDREGPQHLVTVPAWVMGKYPVTQAQWKAVASFPKVNHDLNPDPARFKGANRPVEQVSWHEAVEFCDRLSHRTNRPYRLPSEAEWEYACRAGTTTPFSFGETITTDLANYNGNYTYGAGPKGVSRQETTDVGSFPPNAFGLYDMHGNVWEWCLDHWHDNYTGAPIDGSAWLTGNESTGRIIRGGSWFSDPRGCRSAFRDDSLPDFVSGLIGFRLVCVVPRMLP